MKNLVVKPSSFLRDYIDFYWIYEEDDYKSVPPQLIYPQGGMQLMLHYGKSFASGIIGGDRASQPQAFLCCQKLSSMEVTPVGSIGLISVYFKPYGASLFFRAPFDEAENRNLDLCDLLGDKMKVFTDMIYSAPSVNDKLFIVEKFLLSAFSDSKIHEIKALKAGVDSIDKSGGKISVDEAAGISCFSPRQFGRIFHNRIGITPKQYIRIKKINYAIGLLEARKKINAAQIALESGFYDQAHFINDFKSIVGITPKKFSSLLCAEKIAYSFS